MRRVFVTKAKGYSLVELLIVIATIGLLAAVLLPVFRAARDSARQSVCLTNFKQVSTALQIYLGDYEDRNPPVNHRPGFNGPPGQDRTWVQIVLPYVKSFQVFKCPSDTGRLRGNEGSFDGDLILNDTDIRFFLASQRSNLGYNHQYLAPVVKSSGEWIADPRTASQIGDPSHTLLFADSVWQTDRNDRPSGGGRWLISPPCRYEIRNGVRMDTFASSEHVWTPDSGWNGLRTNLKYGGVWPWHSGHVTVVWSDTSTKVVPLSLIVKGCDARPNWTGSIQNYDDYIWDVH